MPQQDQQYLEQVAVPEEEQAPALPEIPELPAIPNQLVNEETSVNHGNDSTILHHSAGVSFTITTLPCTVSPFAEAATPNQETDDNSFDWPAENKEKVESKASALNFGYVLAMTVSSLFISL